MSHPPEREWTVEEANAALDELRDLVAALVAARKRLDAISRELAQLEATAAGNGHGLAEALTRCRRHLARGTEQTEVCIAAIGEIGVEIKDFEAGLIDFPAVLDGRKVFLCWRLGEERVGFYHPRETGFAGRKPLP